MLFFLDLDRFKEINDRYDHQTGDELLIAVARRLTELLRPGDTCARLGGDEFVILAEDLDGPAQVDTVMRRIRNAFVNPFPLSEITTAVQVSIGVAVADRDGDAPATLIQAADQAMYRDKGHRGPNRTTHHPRAVLPDALPTLLQALPDAIARDELRLEYQPIVSTADGQVSGMEALLRWTHPAHGPVPPAAVIPLAEQSGQIVALGQWVLERACTDQALWHQQSGASLGISVNVSPRQIVSPGFAAAVTDIATAHLARPDLLTLEVTESVMIGDERRARDALRGLKEVGMMLALDDFGTGYSSLSYLSTLPVDVIKIDQRFVSTLTHESASQKIITAIVALARSLQLSVVAEGVETRAQRDELVELQAESCQGFYFARPMAAGEVAPWIERGITGGGPRATHLAAGDPAHPPTPPASEVQRGRRGSSCP